MSRPTTVQADVEGADDTFADLTAPSRTNNIVQIIKQTLRVSRTERRVNVAAVGDPFAFQKADALRQLKMKMEFTLLNAVSASGSSGVARQMNGIDAFITSMHLLWRFICRKCHIKTFIFLGNQNTANKKNGVNSGKPRTGNPEPSQEITKRLLEGVETKLNKYNTVSAPPKGKI